MKTVVSRGDQHPLPDSRAFADMTPRRPHYDIREATSLAAVFCGKSGQFQMERIPTPAPNAGEVLVRIDGCLLSRRSLEGFDSVSARNVRRVFGYENCGTIEALGEGVSSVDTSGNPITIGSRVVWSSTTCCGECFCCSQGLPASCLRAVHYGKVVSRDERVLFGGLAEHVILKPGTQILTVDRDMPIGVAAQIPGATACAAALLNASERISGQRIVIIGAGLTGITLAAMALMLNAENVTLVEQLAARRQTANNIPLLRCVSVNDAGAEISRITDGYGVDIAYDLSGDPRTLETILSLVRLGGKIVFHRFHAHAKRRAICLSQIASRNVSVRGVDGYRAEHLQQAHSFLGRNHSKFHLGALVQSWTLLENAEKAAHAALDMKCLRLGVTPSVHLS